MQRQGKKTTKKAGFFTDPKWTLRRYVRHYKRDRIKEILKKEFGTTLGSNAMLGQYQTAVTIAIKEMSPAMKAEAEQLADQLNYTDPPASVQAWWVFNIETSSKMAHAS
jgi:hypothetical protein